MNYLVSKFDCMFVNDNTQLIEKNVRYKFEKENSFLVFGFNGELPFCFDIHKEQDNVLQVKRGFENYFFISSSKMRPVETIVLTIQKHNISISVSSHLVVLINGNLEYNEQVEKIEYSGYEEMGNLCLLYFKGIRNFLLILEEGKVKIANYYDECNLDKEEKYFMCRLNDSLNHGKVIHIKDKKVENYLVYLDDYDLTLKDNFIANVFLDCVVAGNFKYCNNLLSDSIKQENYEEIKAFFPDFDWYYPIEDNVFVLTRKNTLAGIYKFEIVNSSIENIISE